jgi:hypothetical protein
VPRDLSQGKSGPSVGLKQCSYFGRTGIVSENDKNEDFVFKGFWMARKNY